MAVRSISPPQPTAPPTVWRFFPHAIIALLMTVVAVNFGMIWSATSTFPGAVNENAFDTGNAYNAVLANVERQAALGWQLDIEAEGQIVAIRLVDKDGKPLTGVTLQAMAEHPVGPADRTDLAFTERDGRYLAGQALPGAGQWQIELVAKRDGEEFRATRRLVLR